MIIDDGEDDDDDDEEEEEEEEENKIFKFTLFYLLFSDFEILRQFPTVTDTTIKCPLKGSKGVRRWKGIDFTDFSKQTQE